MSIIGSVLGRFSELELSTADDKHYTLKTDPVSRLAIRLIGLPHLGFRGRARLILREAMRLSTPDTRILDAGCGYGIYSLTLAKNGRAGAPAGAKTGTGRINGIDLTPERIAALERMKIEQPDLMKNIDLQVGSVTKLPYADNTFDLVICSEVIEHISDDHQAARELVRVTKPGGKMIITTPYNSRYNQRIYKKFGHERPGYTKDTYADLFGRNNVTVQKDMYYEYAFGTRLFNGFNTISSKPLMGLMFNPFYALYRLDSLMKIGEPNGIVTVIEKKA